MEFCHGFLEAAIADADGMRCYDSPRKRVAYKMTEIEGADGAAVDSLSKDVTRDELYAMVWQEPMLRIGERFGVSSSFLTRVCISLRVPRPPMGHWTKVEFGRD